MKKQLLTLITGLTVAVGLGFLCQTSPLRAEDYAIPESGTRFSQDAGRAGSSKIYIAASSDGGVVNYPNARSSQRWQSYTPGSIYKQATPAQPFTGKTSGSQAVVQPGTTGTDETVVLQESKPVFARSNQWQQFSQFLVVKPGEDQVPLTLTFSNGVTGSPFRQLRILLSGRVLATDRDFRGKPTLPINVTGAVGAGQNQIIINAQGDPGSTLSWKLTTSKPKITQANPTTVGPDENITITGKNFSSAATNNVVKLGSATLKVKSVDPSHIVTTVSQDVKSGKQPLTVSVGSVTSNAVEVTVKKVPVLESCDIYQSPPGMPIVITGKNFSKTPSENVVTINGVQAPVVSSSPTSLTVTVPDMDPTTCGIEKSPIKVTTNGVASKGDVGILVRTGLQKPYDGTAGWPNF